MTSKELDVHMGRVFRDLHPGFDDTHSVGRVTAVGEAHYESLHGDARSTSSFLCSSIASRRRNSLEASATSL